MSSLTVEITPALTITVTPEILAKAFWQMDTTEQTAFFSALARETLATYEEHLRSGKKSWWTPDAYGTMQWCLLMDDLKKDKEAYAMFMRLASFAYEYYQPSEVF